MSGPRKILLIDDNRTILQGMKKLLAGAGHEVLATSDGREAIGLAAAEQPDLVICDVDMPGMDGGEVAARLAESPRTSHLKLVFFTTLVSDRDPSSVNSGKNIYLSKMTEHAKLLAEIERLLASERVVPGR